MYEDNGFITPEQFEIKQLIEDFKTGQFKKYKNMKEAVQKIHPTDKHLLDFMFLDTLGFVKSEPIHCHHNNLIILDFLKAHKDLTNIIYPNYYTTIIEPLFKQSVNEAARKRIQSKYKYIFN
jgi:hypothetical protein